MASIKIINATRLDPHFPLSRHELLELCEVILEAIGLEGHGFSLTLVDDREIARLNQEFLGCPGPTNILSFPAGAADGEASPDVEEGFLGELALSLNTLARETLLYGQEPTEHLARLLAHGILHLAGYDHGEEMFDLTDTAVDRVALESAGLEHADG